MNEETIKANLEFVTCSEREIQWKLESKIEFERKEKE